MSNVKQLRPAVASESIDERLQFLAHQLKCEGARLVNIAEAMMRVGAALALHPADTDAAILAVESGEIYVRGARKILEGRLNDQ